MEQTGKNLLGELGVCHVLGGDRPFLLDGDACWLVRSGHLDVFSTALGEDGAPSGRRHHRFRLGPNQLALGIGGRDGGQPFGLLGVGTNGAEVIELARNDLEALTSNPRADFDVASLLDDWIDQVCKSMASEAFPDDCLELETGEYEVADETTRVRPKHGTLWVRHERGRSLLLGKPWLELNGTAPTPISPRVWIELPEGSRIVSLGTADVVGRQDLWHGLDRLHELLFDSIVEGAAELDRSARERMQRRAQADRSAFLGAFANIAETLDGRSPLEAASTASASRQDSATLRACRVVGESLGIRVVAPPTAEEESFRDPIALIARVSRFRFRQVILKGVWWRTDGGPFVAFRKDQEGAAVALLRAGSGYVLHDPDTRTQQAVNEAVAEELEPLAYTLYRPMPDKKMGALDLVRFGFQGASRDLTSVLVLSGLIGLIGLVPPMVTRAIFNDVIPSADRGALLQLSLGLALAAVTTGLLSLARSRSIVRIEGQMGTTLQSGVWDRLLSVPMPFFRPYTAGELAVRTLSMEAIRRIISGPVLTSLIAGFFSLLHFGLLFYYNKRLAWWATLVIAVTVAMISFVAWGQMSSERAVAEIRARLSGTLLQFLTSIGKLRVAGAEVHAFALWAQRFSQQRRVQLRSRTLMNTLTTFNSGIPVIANLVIYAVAARMLIDEESLRTGDFLAFITSFGLLLTGVLQASGGLIGAMKIIPAYEQAIPILEALPEVDASKAEPGKIRGEIEVRHLTFRYQADGPLILRDVRFQVQPGEFVALVGPSGSGKSTLLRLLLGFETPDSGAIYYDGQELAGLDLQALRGQIGTVLQNGRLTSGDIFSNITGSSRATLDDAWAAARMAGLDGDIKSMPMGMHTVLSEGATTISGGQRQRLLIARALVNKPRIVFFDEATSALDNRTQAIVTESLDAIQATRIVVAHRLSTIQRADRIYVLAGGQIVESGPFDELLAQDGVFAELARRQLS